MLLSNGVDEILRVVLMHLSVVVNVGISARRGAHPDSTADSGTRGPGTCFESVVDLLAAYRSPHCMSVTVGRLSVGLYVCHDALKCKACVELNCMFRFEFNAPVTSSWVYNRITAWRQLQCG